MSRLRVLSLFAGIGGFDLGLERTGGFETAAFCEIDPFCRRVLAKHWPEVTCYDDVRELTAERLRGDGIEVDCIVGGFPCQDISFAGLGAGLAGERSGLWSEFARLIDELRPRFVIVENVSALLVRGIGDVLGTLASFGYDAEWHCIPASAVGAPHRRDRIWIVGYPSGAAGKRHTRAVLGAQTGERGAWEQNGSEPHGLEHAGPGERGGLVADTARIGCGQGWAWGAAALREMRQTARPALANADSERGRGRHAQREDAEDARQSPSGSWVGQWDAEPNVGRVANGVPARVDRLRSLGNAVVPQIPELIGRAILAVHS